MRRNEATTPTMARITRRTGRVPSQRSSSHPRPPKITGPSANSMLSDRALPNPLYSSRRSACWSTHCPFAVRSLPSRELVKALTIYRASDSARKSGETLGGGVLRRRKHLRSVAADARVEERVEQHAEGE